MIFSLDLNFFWALKQLQEFVPFIILSKFAWLSPELIVLNTAFNTSQSFFKPVYWLLNM